MNNIVMIGPQGSGKGTQGELLSKQLEIPIASLGQLLRAETDRNTGLGRDIAGYLQRGEMVPSDIVYHLILDRLEEQDTEHGVILDGYPRKIEQAETLDDIMTRLDRQVTHAFYLDISDDTAVERISGRRVCSNPRCGANYHVENKKPKTAGKCDVCGRDLMIRKDDDPDTVRRRLDLFHQETAPLADYYDKRGIMHRIDATGTIQEVNQTLLGILGVEPKSA